MSLLAETVSSNIVRDAGRLAAVRATGLLDSPAEDELDRLTRLAAKLTGAPVTFISLVDEDRDFYKSCFGFPEPLSTERQIGGTTFCHYALVSNGPLVINDTLAHPIYRNVPTVESLGVRAYVGVPLITSAGQAIGSFCALDFQPRAWTELDVEVLVELAVSTLRLIELRMAHKNVEDERKRLEATIHNIPSGMMVADAQGRIILSNTQAGEILGRQLTDLREEEPRSARHPNGTPYSVDDWPLARAVKLGETVTGEEITFERPNDGEQRIISVSAAPVRDDNQHIIGAVAMLHDVTSDRTAAAEQRLILMENLRLYEEAQQASHAKDEFFASVTHELRTPMTSILGWARLLEQEQVDNPLVQEAAEAIASSAKLQAQLVDDLLDVARIASGKITLALRQLDVNDVINEALVAAEPTAASKGIRLRPRLGAVPPIDGDRGRLRQVVSNLLSNAVKFTPTGGFVEVSSSQQDGSVCIHVRDTGRGLREDLLATIFERGQQATDGEQGGLGLGLTIVRHLVELHGGSVHACSDGEGKGATFTVLLPKA
jgi:PAS domain S-box-containing protein